MSYRPPNLVVQYRLINPELWFSGLSLWIKQSWIKMSVDFEISTIIVASPQEIYVAWLDSERHAAMTGSAARCSAQVGDSFDAWDGYIHGINLALERAKRIVQSWRTIEFNESDPDSQIELTFEPVVGGTKVTLRHSNLPAHGDQYKQGWVDSYFEPMKEYFERS